MVIRVRVESAAALAQMRAIEMQNQRTAASVRGIGAAASYGIPMLSKWGSQVQWAGRQLMYNFTLPIALAIGMATKWALENEKAMVRVSKVYGDGSKVFNRLSKTELPALGDAFEALSNRFGVAQKDVINIAGDWAAAGASGVALAKVVKLTLETMVLGEIDAAEATRNLIAIQAQYGMSTTELTKTIDILNMVENQTGATMQDLMNGMARAAGVARTAGIDVEHLSAMMAGLVPATGSAASAGNGLKTIISRLLAPTSAATDLMAEMGVQVNDTAWASLNGTQRLEAMSKAYADLSDQQKIQVSSIVASRYQVNRFSVLMDAMINQNSYYNKSLRATNDRQKIFAQRVKELNQVLESNPQKMKQAWVILQNALADVIIPILPFLVYLAQEVARLFHAFEGLGGPVQKLVLSMLVLLALLGPIARYVGAVAVLFGLLSAAAHWFAVKMGIAAIATEIETAAVERSRKGLIGFMLTMLATPFKMFSGGIGMITTSFTWLFGKIVAVIAAEGIWAALNKGLLGIPILGAALGFLVGMFGLVGKGIMGMIALMKSSTVLASVWASIWGAVTALFAVGEAVTLAGFFGWLTAMRTSLYIWMVNVGARFRAFVALLGAIFSLLPVFIGETMSAVWAMMVVPGMLSGRLIAIWTMIAGAIQTIWIAMYQGMIAISGGFAVAMKWVWAALVIGMGAATSGLAILWRTMLAVMNAYTLAWVARTVVLMSELPALLMAAVAAIPGLIAAALGAIFSPIGIAIAVVLGLAYAFKDKIIAAFWAVVNGMGSIGSAIVDMWAPFGTFFNGLIQHIVDAFWALPEGVRSAMIAVVTIVRDAALAVYEWFSYINPFAHHSPSLVESVTSGMNIIVSQFARARGVGSIFKKAAADLAAFKRIAASSGQGEWSDQRKDVRKSMPTAMPVFNSLVSDLNKLNPILDRQQAKVDAQQKVLDRWSAALDKANNKLERQQKILDRLQGRLQSVQDRYDAHEQALQNFASAPLAGMHDMNDAIFQNEMAQKRLQLQMMQWEKVNGSIDDMRSRLNSLYGDIELLTGQAKDLRMGGAGSDILGPIEAQIAAMEAQAQATADAINNSPISAMQQQLDDLQQQGQILQLQYDIKFDPLTHAIQDLANAQQELTFDEIVNGIRNEQAAMDSLQPTIDQLTNAVAAQQAVVDAATQSRDRLQDRYDRENKKLQKLQDNYQKTADLIREIESALNDMGSAAAAAADKANKGSKPAALSGAQSQFAAGAAGNFPDVGGQNAIGREGGLQDQAALIEQFTQDTMADMTSIFGSFDMFSPIKKWWTKTWDWISKNLGPVGSDLSSGIKDMLSGATDGLGSGGGGLLKKIQPFLDVLFDIGRTIGKWFKAVWRLLGPDIKKIGKLFQKFGQDIWREVGPELAKFGPVLKKLGPALRNLWKIAKPVLAILAASFLLFAEVFSEVFVNVLGPVLDWVVSMLKNLVRVIRGIFEVFIGVFTGDWEMAKQGVIDIVEGLAWAVIDTFKYLGQALWGLVKGIVNGVIDFFVWLYDELVGHSVIPDMINAIIWWFGKLVGLAKWLWNNVLKPIYQAFKTLWTDYVKPAIKLWWSGIRTEWTVLKKVAGWLWDNVLKPVYVRVKALWDNYVGPALREWWGRIQNAWNALRALAGWVWSNILQPVLSRIKGLWSDHVKPELMEWRNRIEKAWDGLVTLAKWVKTNVMDPIFEAFKTGWGKIKEWFQSSSDTILAPIQSVVNGIVNAINWIIKGLNKLDALPGVSISISEIATPFAQGGTMPSRRVDGGFKTNGARAIVGEGKANYPEYVIPTDPTYRHRAQSLMMQASDKLNMSTVPMHAAGGMLGNFDWTPGPIGDAIDLGQAAWDQVKDAGKMAIAATMAPFIAGAKLAAKSVDWSVGQDAANGAIDVTARWVRGAQETWSDQWSDLNQQNSTNGYTNFPTQGGDWARMSFRGVTMDVGQVRAVLAAEKMLGSQYHITQGSYSNSVSQSAGTHAGGGAFDATSPVTNAALSALRKNGQAAWIRTPSQGDWPYHIHSLHIGDPNLSAPAQAQVQSFLAGGDGLKLGGIVRARAGGSQFTIGEGGQDEAVIPLPNDWRRDVFGGNSRGGDTVIQINGDLSFPNIKSGDDAETFISNLKVLAKE